MKFKKRMIISGTMVGLCLANHNTSYAFDPSKEMSTQQIKNLVQRTAYQPSIRSNASTPILRTVTFTDVALEQAVKSALSLPESTVLTTAHLSQLYMLEAPSSGITQLNGLENATNLISLDLNQNQIQDLSPLASLQNIEWLKLEGNQIQRLEPIQNFSRLKQLIISHNPIESIEPIQYLTTLQYLDLVNLNLTDISCLTPLNELLNLNLNDNQIEDLTPLINKTKLNELYLNNNLIQNLSPLSGLTQLKQLYLISNQIGDVSPLSSLNQLQTIRLNSNNIEDFSSIQSFNGRVDFEAYDQEVRIFIENLLHYQFENPLYAFSSTPMTWQYPNGEWEYLTQPSANKLQIIQPFSALPHQMNFGEWDQNISWVIELTEHRTSNSDQIVFEDNQLKQAILEQLSLSGGEVTKFDILSLYELDIENRNIQNLKGLEYATNLTTLNANGNQINDLSPLSEITTLEWVKLNDNQITSIDPLLKSKALKQLSLANNPIQDIRSISTFSELIYLTLDETRITNWSPLTQLKKLEILSVNSNNISDVTIFSKMTHLHELHLYDNRIDTIEPLKTLTNLTTLNVSNNQVADLSSLKSLTQLTNVYAYKQIISIFVSENKVGKELANPIKAVDGSSVSWQLTSEQEELLGLSPDATLITLKKTLPNELTPITFLKDDFSGIIQLKSQQSESEIELRGVIEPTILSINVPTQHTTFKLNPNLPSDQMFIATEFLIENDSNAPIEVSILAFEETTDLMNDVMPNTHEDWESLTDSSRFDFALGLKTLSSEGWESQPTTTYVANTYPKPLGVIKGNEGVLLTFEAKHGIAFKQTLNPEYRLVFSFELKQ